MTSCSGTVTYWIRLYSIHTTTRVNLGCPSYGRKYCHMLRSWDMKRRSVFFTATVRILSLLSQFLHTFLVKIKCLINRLVIQMYALFSEAGRPRNQAQDFTNVFHTCFSRCFIMKSNIRACIQCYQVARTRIFSACDLNLKCMPNMLLYLKL